MRPERPLPDVDQRRDVVVCHWNDFAVQLPWAGSGCPQLAPKLGVFPALPTTAVRCKAVRRTPVGAGGADPPNAGSRRRRLRVPAGAATLAELEVVRELDGPVPGFWNDVPALVAFCLAGSGKSR